MCCHLPELLNRNFIFPATVLPIYFGSTNPGKTRAHAGPILPFTTEKLAHFGSTNPGKTRAHAGPILPFTTEKLTIKHFTFFYFSEDSTSILFWEYCSRKKHRRESSAFWKYCSRKKRPRLSQASAPALTLAQFYLFLFFRSTESHGKTRSVFTPPKKTGLLLNFLVTMNERAQFGQIFSEPPEGSSEKVVKK